MPFVDGELVTPDEALAADHCPECGADFSKIDARAHRQEHWKAQPPNGPKHDESRRRIALYEQYLRDHAVSAAAAQKQKPRTAAA